MTVSVGAGGVTATGAGTGVLVLGMHRSGTSAVTRMVNLGGFDAGVGVLMGAAPSNPTGHWEVAELTALNDQVLDQLGGRWAAPPPLHPDRRVDLAAGALGERAGRLFDGVFPTRPWVWKDPRASLLVPFWRALLEARAPLRAVLVLRPGAEVAASLRRRDGMAAGYGLALWERYNRTLLADLADLPVTVVHYERLLADPVGTAERVLAFAGRETPLDDAERLAVAGYVDAGHRHRDGLDDIAPTAEQEALADTLEGLGGDHPDGLGPVPLGAETPNLQLAFAEHKRLSRFEEVANRFHDDQQLVEKLEAEVALLKEDLEARSQQASELADGLMATQEHLTAARAEAAEWEAKLLEIYGRWPVRVYGRLRRLLGRGDP